MMAAGSTSSHCASRSCVRSSTERTNTPPGRRARAQSLAGLIDTCETGRLSIVLDARFAGPRATGVVTMSGMPGRRWTVTELQVLRRQVAAGCSFREIVVEHRSPFGIRYQLWRLDLYPTHRWTPEEVEQLRQQASAGQPLWRVAISDRSRLAIRQKMIRLHLWQPCPRTMTNWTTRELRRLAHLVRDCGYTAQQAVSNGYFPGRTVDAIAQQMRRHGLRRTGADRTTRQRS